ncbi:hypothetical protein BDV97DRAFT_139950 [Delphinella strobiligena]|nr:hypothetical protein BDV97DRAFT_139950 [Delphinella strobiligena]
MPFTCPLALIRRVGQVSVNRHVSRLTELRHLRHALRSFTSIQSLVSDHAPWSSSIAEHRDDCHSSERNHTVQDAHSNGSREKRAGRRTRKHVNPGLMLQEILRIAANKGIAPSYYINPTHASATTPNALKRLLSRAEELSTDFHDNDKPDMFRGTSALQAVLAKKILKMVDEQIDNTCSLNRHTTTRDNQLLLKHGYDVTDLHNWISILTTQDSLRAARLLTGASGPPESLVDDHNSIPAFVFLTLLRRRQLSPAALRLLVEYLPTWCRAVALSDSTGLSTWPRDSAASPDQYEDTAEPRPDLRSAVFRACMRSCRHARRVWPAAVPAIARNLISFLRLPPSADSAIIEDELPAQPIAELTKLFNRALHLIGQPIAIEPFKSLGHQETAQALILRHMAEHTPPLAINREGYRAVTRVQLAHKKTSTETEWARLKSPSWPPWKEDRTGMDVNVGLEYGLSRARHILNRMQEAGYSMKAWDDVALIHSGWDTDMSPTIQTRALMPAVSNQRNERQIWAARIRSTRTVQQAWACFLSYEDKAVAADEDVYLAMFERLREERKRHRLGEKHPTHSARQSDVLPFHPGDGREVFPPPTSTHQAIYTKTAPPSMRQFHEHMLERKMLPSGQTLAFIATNATSLKEGLSYLQSSSAIYPDIIPNFLYRESTPDRLSHVPNAVFAATISLLTRFPHNSLKRSDRGESMYNYGEYNVDLHQSLGRAIYVLDNERRPYRPAWNALLSSFARRDAPTISPTWRLLFMQPAADPAETARQALDKMVAYKLTKHTLTLMRDIDVTLDADGFRHVCIIAENAATVAAQIIAKHGNKASAGSKVDQSSPDQQDESLHGHAIEIRKESQYLRYQFRELVSVSSDRSLDPALPTLLVTPSLAILHAYIRALGSLRDFEGLRETVHWMREYWAELSARKDEDRRGVATLRKCIVALRVFLDGHWENNIRDEQLENRYEQEPESIQAQSYGTYENGIGASGDCLDDVQDIVESMEDWGSWASDEEVVAYMENRLTG